jgi:hypothetical protein
MARMLLGDPAGQGRADRARGNVDRIRGENSRQPLRPERDGCKGVVVGKRGDRHIAGGKIGELRRSADAGKRRYLLRVSVIDGHLITVFDKVDGKSVSHMAETDYSNTTDHEFGGSGRFTRSGGRSGHEFLAGRKAGDVRVSRLVLRLVELELALSNATALPRKPGQAAARISYPVDFVMNSSRVWQTIADGARPCADALISAFRA